MPGKNGNVIWTGDLRDKRLHLHLKTNLAFLFLIFLEFFKTKGHEIVVRFCLTRKQPKYLHNNFIHRFQNIVIKLSDCSSNSNHFMPDTHECS